MWSQKELTTAAQEQEEEAAHGEAEEGHVSEEVLHVI